MAAAKSAGDTRLLSQRQEDEDETFESTSYDSSEDWKFDEAIGFLQDILLDEKFITLQRGFLEEHYFSFEDVEENKLFYLDIFEKYSGLVEKHLENELRAKMQHFTMDTFMSALKTRKNEVGEEIQDLLSSFSDFLSFKQTILDYKAEKEGRSLDLSGLLVQPAK